MISDNFAMFGSMHEEALARLCFVCGSLLKDSLHYEVDTHLELISVGLNIPCVTSIPGVTPSNFCYNCHQSFRHVAGGTTVKTTRTLHEWVECGTECCTCALLVKRKQVCGRPPKKKIRLLSSFPPRFL